MFRMPSLSLYANLNKRLSRCSGVRKRGSSSDLYSYETASSVPSLPTDALIFQPAECHSRVGLTKPTPSSSTIASAFSSQCKETSSPYHGSFSANTLHHTHDNRPANSFLSGLSNRMSLTIQSLGKGTAQCFQPCPASHEHRTLIDHIPISVPPNNANPPRKPKISAHTGIGRAPIVSGPCRPYELVGSPGFRQMRHYAEEGGGGSWLR
jgi:hypothetical protein